MNRGRAGTLAFWLFAAVALSWQLGSRALNEPDEGRAAGIAREMQSAGSWLMPRLYDHAHLDKPPLLYWLLQTTFAIGGVNEWTARLPTALSALAVMGLTAALARRMRGRGAGLPAAALLLACPLFFAQARVLDYNMVLTAWFMLAIWSAWAWMQEGRPHQRGLFYFALALAFLTKGPVGPVLVMAGLLVYRLTISPDAPGRPLWHGPSALACAAVGLSWHVGMATAHPELWSFFLGRELAGRVLTAQHGRSEHLLFYAAILPLSMLPWLPAAGRALLRLRADWRASPAHRLLWGICGTALLIFTLSQSKLPTYILPLLPLICIAIVPRPGEGGPTWSPRELTAALVVACAIPLLVAWYGQHAFGWSASGVWWATLPLLPTLAAAVWIHRRPSAAAFWQAWPAIIAAFLATHHLVCQNQSRLGSHTSARGVAMALRNHWQPGDQVALVGRYPRGVAFYFPGPVSVYLEKYPLQIHADRARVAGKDFAEAAEVFARFDQTGRVFFVASPEVAAEREREARRPVHRLFDDARTVLISNAP